VLVLFVRTAHRRAHHCRRKRIILARIFWDSNLFIYLLEGADPRAARVESLWLGMKARGDRLYTSALTIGEVLVKPVAEGARALQQDYLRLMQSPAISILSFDFRAALAYARVRGDRSIKPPDALQLACASSAEIDLFITNDDRLSRKRIPEIKFITSLDRAPI
jgi:predicted nucleic acid-binding protein